MDITIEHQGWAMARHDPVGPPVGPDLLLVHGMGVGGWIWPPEMLARMTGAGRRVWALTLPGRQGGASMATDPDALPWAFVEALEAVAGGAAPGTGLRILSEALPSVAALKGPTLSDYTDALAEAIESLDAPVRVVGYSLGGAVVQNLLRRGRVAKLDAVALVCSAPPYGLWRASAEMALVRPALWLELMRYATIGVRGVDEAQIRRALFPSGISDQRFRALADRLSDESLLAMAQASGFPPFAPFPGPQRDMLVIGGGQDQLVPAADIWGTALYYGTAPQFLQQSGHAPMLDAGAASLADLLTAWGAP